MSIKNPELTPQRLVLDFLYAPALLFKKDTQSHDMLSSFSAIQLHG